MGKLVRFTPNLPPNFFNISAVLIKGETKGKMFMKDTLYSSCMYYMVYKTHMLDGYASCCQNDLRGEAKDGTENFGRFGSIHHSNRN